MKYKKKMEKLERRRRDWAAMKGRGETKQQQRYTSGGYREPGAIK